MAAPRRRAPKTDPIAAFRAALGDAHVITDEAALTLAATATFATTARASAILRPRDTAEVQACLRIARDHRVAIYPTSGGRNWGYGSRAPTSDGAALLDLGRLDRILDYDDEMGTVTVEAGVTFGQLARFLVGKKARFFASVPGAGPDASVIGNCVERGDGAGPLGDRAAHACAFEVVLPTGERIETGFARLDGARVARLTRHDLGPSLDGLFLQSNLGVVTRMTIFLQVRPAFFRVARFAVEDLARLPALVDALRALRLEGTVRSLHALWNDWKAISLLGPYPFEATAGRTPLPPAFVEAIRRDAGFGRVSGTLPLYAASSAQGEADEARVAEVLADHVDLLAVDDPGDLDWSDLSARGPLLGAPHEVSIASLYYRKRFAPTRIAPEADRCGLHWVTPAVPFRGADAAEAFVIAEEVVMRHRFEPQVAAVCVTDRVISFCAAIVYDRDVEGEDARARACHDELLARFESRGFPPFRLGIQSMPLAPRGDEETARFRARLKEWMDPGRVLAPGRYER